MGGPRTFDALPGALRVRLADGNTVAVDELADLLAELAEAVDLPARGGDAATVATAARLADLAERLGVIVATGEGATW